MIVSLSIDFVVFLLQLLSPCLLTRYDPRKVSMWWWMSLLFLFVFPVC